MKKKPSVRFRGVQGSVTQCRLLSLKLAGFACFKRNECDLKDQLDYSTGLLAGRHERSVAKHSADIKKTTIHCC